MEAPEGPLPLDEQITDLKRRLRLITQEAKHFGDTAQVQLRKQRASIEKLKSENSHIKQDVEQTKEALSQQQNTLLGTRMQQLNEQCQILLHEIAEGKKEEKELLENINVMEGRVRKCREIMGSLGGVYAAEITSEAIERQTRILENRLDKALQKYSQATTQNKKLKAEINSLRRERVAFDNLYKKAESDLLNEKRVVLELIKEANHAYAARDAAQKRIAALKTDEAKERKNFEVEWAHLIQFLENLQMRQWTRYQAKRMADLEAKRTSHEGDEEESQNKGDLWGDTNEDSTGLCDISKLKSYQVAFAKIQAATGISSVEELIEAFRVAEEHNFSLFSYVNALSDEVEAHETAIQSLRAALQTCTDAQKKASRQRHDENKEWEGQSCAMETRIKTLETENASALEQLQEVMQKTRIMFENVGAGRKYGEALWAKEDVTEVNITNYLQAVEEAVDELVLRLRSKQADRPSETTTESKQQKKTTAKGENMATNKPPQPQIKAPSAVNRASSLDTSDEEDADTRPLSREELLKRLQRSKTRRSERERIKPKKSTAK